MESAQNKSDEVLLRTIGMEVGCWQRDRGQRCSAADCLGSGARGFIVRRKWNVTPRSASPRDDRANARRNSAGPAFQGFLMPCNRRRRRTIRRAGGTVALETSCKDRHAEFVRSRRVRHKWRRRALVSVLKKLSNMPVDKREPIQNSVAAYGGYRARHVMIP